MVRIGLFLPAILLTIPALAKDATPTDNDKPIVITGVRTADLRNKLDQCIAKNCPPDQEIAATLAVAENQFVEGKYTDARSTLLKSIGRNKRYAKDYPEPVSNLMRANYRIAEHLGDGESYRIGTFDTISALKAGLTDDDPRVLGAQIEVGDMYVNFSRTEDAVNKYTEVERRAAKLGLYNIQGMARLRVVMLYGLLAAQNPTQYKSAAHKAANWLIDNTDPHMKPFGQAARVMMARLDAKTGDTAAVDKLIADYPTADTGNLPVLLYAPPMASSFTDRRGPLSSTADVTMLQVARVNYDDEWIDIGFWVAPDGHVTDADLLRTGKGGDYRPDWVKPILASIGGRRYAPLKIESSQPGVFRVERYTLTAWQTTNTGSRMVVRDAQPQIQMLDLSVDPPAKTGTRGG